MKKNTTVKQRHCFMCEKKLGSTFTTLKRLNGGKVDFCVTCGSRTQGYVFAELETVADRIRDRQTELAQAADSLDAETNLSASEMWNAMNEALVFMGKEPTDA
jgi:predicted  nucleic acid-binding Zn-ribbon protein